MCFDIKYMYKDVKIFVFVFFIPRMWPKDLVSCSIIENNNGISSFTLFGVNVNNFITLLNVWSMHDFSKSISILIYPVYFLSKLLLYILKSDFYESKQSRYINPHNSNNNSRHWANVELILCYFFK